MIYEALSVISTIVLLIASLFIFYLQTRFTRGFMKNFVSNSAICFFLILSERIVDTIGEFIYGIDNKTYYPFSLLLIIGAIIFFLNAIKSLKVIKSFIQD